MSAEMATDLSPISTNTSQPPLKAQNGSLWPAALMSADTAKATSSSNSRRMTRWPDPSGYIFLDAKPPGNGSRFDDYLRSDVQALDRSSNRHLGRVQQGV